LFKKIILQEEEVMERVDIVVVAGTITVEATNKSCHERRNPKPY
jgi:hypothetical protein